MNAAAPAPVPAEGPRSRPAKAEAFTLIGTGLYPGGAVACFDGNREEFKTSAHPGEKIGGCTVETVAFDHVKLRSGTREFELRMAMQLRRENNGPWQLLALTERFTPADQPPAPEFRPAPPGGFAPPPPEGRPPARPDRGPTDKEMRRLDKPPEELVKAVKEFKREQAAEAGFIKKVEKELREVEKAARREQ